MHRLVANYALQYGSRRLPIDDTQLQKATIEPRNEELFEVRLYHLEIRVGLP